MGRVGLTPESVTAAGAELADDSGFESVTPSEVARRLGVQTASIYFHVPNATALKTRVATLAVNELADFVSDAIVGRSGTDALVGMASAYRLYAQRHPGRFAATLWSRLDDAYIDASRRHTRLIEAVLSQYELPPLTVPHAVRFIGSTIRGFVTLEANGNFSHSEASIADSWAHLVSGLDAAIRHWPVVDSQLKGGVR